MFIIVAMVSCESRSSQIAKEQSVKVVVIDGTTNGVPGGRRSYKIKVLNKGVVGYVSSLNLYEANDTILVKPSLIRY